MILKLQVFEVIRIALQNIKTDGSRFLRLRNENNNNKTSDLFPTSAMQSLPQNTSLWWRFWFYTLNIQLVVQAVSWNFPGVSNPPKFYSC